MCGASLGCLSNRFKSNQSVTVLSFVCIQRALHPNPLEDINLTFWSFVAFSLQFPSVDVQRATNPRVCLFRYSCKPPVQYCSPLFSQIEIVPSFCFVLLWFRDLHRPSDRAVLRVPSTKTSATAGLLHFILTKLSPAYRCKISESLLSKCPYETSFLLALQEFGTSSIVIEWTRPSINCATI